MSIGIVSAIVIGVSFVIGAVTSIIIKKKDSPVEQFAEYVIKKETGIDVDFTPEEQEKLKKEEEEYESTESEE